MVKRNEGVCEACDEPIRPGEPYYDDIDGGHIHAACIGEDPTAFVNLNTGVPLDHTPAPSIWGTSH